LAITYETVRYGEIDVCWLPELDGGGMTFGQDFIPIVSSRFGHVGRICEVCAGPGFIGFSLLAQGMCDSLLLVDINPAAVAATEETIRRNGLEDRVKVYLSDGMKSVPAEEKCDLFVSNPPHFISPVAETVSLLSDDLDWKMHREFYADVARYLTPGGSVLFQENSEGALPEDFLPMVEAGGLESIQTLWYAPNGNSTVFYMWIKAKTSGLFADECESAPEPIDLTEPKPGSVKLSAGQAYALRVHNRTGRTVKVRLTDTCGGEPLGAKAREFLALTAENNGELTLPRVTLKPGNYFVLDDADTDIVLARLQITV